jgi:hypothetical protein
MQFIAEKSVNALLMKVGLAERSAYIFSNHSSGHLSEEL